MTNKFWKWLTKPPVEVEVGSKALDEHQYAVQRAMKSRREIRRDVERKVREASEILVSALEKDINR